MNLLIALACVPVFVVCSLAQLQPKAASAADLYDLGGRSIRIPAPDNFTDTVPTFPRIAARLIASENPMNEVLAVHVINDVLPQIRAGAEPDLPFCTKVSVWKELKSADVSAAEFALLAAQFESQVPGALKTEMPVSEKGVRERLKEHWGTETNLKVGETRMLGHFDKQAQAISSLFLVNLEMFNRKMLVIGSMSLVHVKGRVIFLYVFRFPESGDDPSLVTDFTKAWTAKLIAANR